MWFLVTQMVKTFGNIIFHGEIMSDNNDVREEY